jgi:L-amino acid N-acyltransferase YncA
MEAGSAVGSQVTCRLAEPRDVEALAEIHVAAYEAHNRGVMPDEVLDSRTVEVRRRMWADLLENPRPGHIVTVAELDGEVVGFATAEPSWYEDHDPAKVIDLSRIYLRPGFEGHRVGAALYDDQERRWLEAGMEAVTGQIAENNELSIRFFEKRGWRFDGHERRVEGGQIERRTGKSLIS